ncbi:MAG: ABC transporter permease [Acidobacteriota bacterium]
MSFLGPAGLSLIVRRSLRRHALSTTVTVLSVALAAGLTMAVFALQSQTHKAFTGGPVGFDAVLGARGSKLQLVLNSVFHLETSPGNLPWAFYDAMKKDRRRVALALPMAVGDNYQGYRIVGTTDEIFTKFEYQAGKTFEIEEGGRYFDSEKNEAVIGSVVAERTGLKLGDIFQPYHGLVYDESMIHQDDYVVVGIKKPTNSPSDRVIWIPIEGVYRMSGHVLRGSGEAYEPQDGEAIPMEHREVSAVMLKFRSPQAGFSLDQTVNKQGTAATLAWPIGNVMAELFEKLGWMSKVLAIVAYLVVFVTAGSILASIYNTMNERRREFAILRALGARRRVVFSAIVLEAAAIGFLGCLLGFLAYLAISVVTASIIRTQTGVVLDPFSYHPVLLWGPLGIVALAALAGVIPALKGYATDVASNLQPHS